MSQQHIDMSLKHATMSRQRRSAGLIALVTQTSLAQASAYA